MTLQEHENELLKGCGKEMIEVTGEPFPCTAIHICPRCIRKIKEFNLTKQLCYQEEIEFLESINKELSGISRNEQIRERLAKLKGERK